MLAKNLFLLINKVKKSCNMNINKVFVTLNVIYKIKIYIKMSFININIYIKIFGLVKKSSNFFLKGLIRNLMDLWSGLKTMEDMTYIYYKPFLMSK